MPSSRIQRWANPRRILLATSLSDLKFTLPIAMQQALAYKAELKIAHILPNLNTLQIDPVLMAYCSSGRMQKTAENALKKSVATVERAGIRCSSSLVPGVVVEEVIRIADKWKADRLVAGSQGKAKPNLHLLGSVAESIFHSIEIPALAVGPKLIVKKTSSQTPMRIVFAASLDHDSSRMAEFALSVAENHGADISLVHVCPEVTEGHPSAARVTGYAKIMLQELLTMRTIKKSRPSCEVVQGQPVGAILDYAKQHSANMIILGASAHSAFDSRFIPGTAYRVLCESQCPVLVLKQESAWGTERPGSA